MSIAANEGMPTRWILLAGFETDLASSLENAIYDGKRELNYRVLKLDRNPSLIDQYRSFASDAHDWICLVGMGEAADSIAREYYDFLNVKPPHSVVLLSPSVTAFDLNRFSCPYLVIHGERDPLLKETPHEEFDKAILHHQMRYGDPTNDFIAPEDGRNLAIEKNGRRELDPVVIQQISDWLTLSPDLGYSKEGMHARGFRSRPLYQLRKKLVG
jgi:hypothetical protein